MSISDLDVEAEPRSGSRLGVVLLGIASAIAGVLAIIGRPLPVLSSTHGLGQQAWARSVREVQGWFAHDGWRMSRAAPSARGCAVTECLPENPASSMTETHLP